MKKLLPLLSLILLLTACGGKATDSSNASEGVSNGDTPIGGNSSGADSGQNIVHDNPREYYTDEEAAEIIDRSANMKTAEGFYSLAPKSIDHVSEFYSSTAEPLPHKEGLEELLSVFEYLFPEHEFNKNCLFFYSPLPEDPEEIDAYDDENGNYIKGENYYASLGLHPLCDEKYYDRIISGEMGTGYFFYHEDLYPNENSVSFTMRSPFGNDICTFNKGVAQKICEQRYFGKTEYYAWELFQPGSKIEHGKPETFFEYVGTFPSDSEESFMLLDKEISIKHAVQFFEDYIANIPCTSSNSAYGIHVNEVSVYKADDEHYCYEYTTSRIYDGIPFDYAYDGTETDANKDLATAIMIKSDDVDVLYASYRAYAVSEETPHTEMIPFKEAVKITSDKMTDYVDFQVMRAELMYRSKGNISGSWLIGEDKEPVYPSWKFLLYNPNDDSYYAAYVNALTGEFSARH